MLPDGLERLARRDQKLVLLLARRAIIVIDADHLDAITRPFAREPRRHLGLRPRAAAVVGNEADGLEARELEAPRDAFEHTGIDLVRHADGAGKAHVALGRRVAPFWHVG